MTTATTVTITVGHNVGTVLTHSTDDIVRVITPLLAEVFTVASGVGNYTATDGTLTTGEGCTVLVGTVFGYRWSIASYLAHAATKLGQESIGLVWNATGDDSLVFAD